MVILGLSVALVICGIAILLKSGTSHEGHAGGMTRASTSIEFGADFYSTSAQATGLAANAVIDLYSIFCTVAGILFIFIGGMSTCVVLIKNNIKELFKKENTVATDASIENPLSEDESVSTSTDAE